ncbi:teichoic acid D-Ala incorporation-associated protein DltX [Streptococcus suis]|nr:teichoic acid D-Ala incorporation-associated protein DltX [Streptococcus suis]
MKQLKKSNHWPVYRFIGQTLFYFLIIMILLYFFGYAGHGQGKFIYNEF